MQTKNDLFADLHTHTSESDGLLSPIQLIDEAAEQELAAIAITDHDTVAAFSQAQAYAKQYGIEVIPGIELSASVVNTEVHILGYFIDPQSDLLATYLTKLVQARVDRAHAIVDNLNALGHPIEFEHVLVRAEKDVIARPHIAEAMVDCGIVDTYIDAFDLWIADGKPACVEKENPTAESVIELIHSICGIAVLAHPGIHFPMRLLRELMKSGLDGIEVVHPRHNLYAQNHFMKVAQDSGLVMTGGSDYHGGRKLNETVGSHSVPYKFVEQLRLQHLAVKRKNLQI